MSLTVRALTETDVEPAEKVVRLAFGTYLGMPDPSAFGGDSTHVATRRPAWPEGALVAEKDGAIAGVAISSRWGSIGLFGPLAVHPDHWRSGVARRLLDATMPIYDRWRCRAAVLFTFPASTTHVGLYQSFGFWPRSLTAIMRRPVAGPSPVPEARALSTEGAARATMIAACTALTHTLCDGLDLADEIRIALAHPGCETIVLTEASHIVGFAICHGGRNSEAETGTVHAKFAMAKPGPRAAHHFHQLIEACNDFAHRRGAEQLTAGVNTGCMEAYRLMMAAGFRTAMQGVAMHRPWTDIYDRPDVFALEDWR